jgi:hypothetical protein
VISYIREPPGREVGGSSRRNTLSLKAVQVHVQTCVCTETTTHAITGTVVRSWLLHLSCGCRRLFSGAGGWGVASE